MIEDPVEQFRQWFEEAKERGCLEHSAFALATADNMGIPSVRMVLLKGYDKRGFVFFTNLESRKCRDLAQNPHAALNFFWPELDRQIIIEGKVERASRLEAENYFATRAKESRLGAWASRQDKRVESREELVRKVEEVKERFKDKDIPCPPWWGGWRVIPSRFEFWQGQPGRLHDRFEYIEEKNRWKIWRLSP